MLGPLFLLRRLYTRTARVEHVQLNSVGAAPPIRRAGTLVSASAGSAPLPGLNPLASTSASPLPSITASDPLLKPAVDWTNFGHTGEEEEDYGVPPPPPPTDAELDVDNSLDALKAIGIATAAVSLGAAGLFFGVKHWMGVSTVRRSSLSCRFLRQRSDCKNQRAKLDYLNADWRVCVSNARRFGHGDARVEGEHGRFSQGLPRFSRCWV